MKPNVLYYNENTIVGTANDLYLEMRRKIADDMMRDEELNISDTSFDLDVVDALNTIIHDALQDETALYMVVWSAMRFPSIWKLNAGDEPLWEK